MFSKSNSRNMLPSLKRLNLIGWSYLMNMY